MQYNFETILVNPKNFFEKIKLYDNYLCFNALHGPYGEDGTIQKILESNNLFFTHSNSTVSKIAFNKNLTKLKIQNNEIITIESIILNKSQITEDRLKAAYKKFNSYKLLIALGKAPTPGKINESASFNSSFLLETKGFTPIESKAL